MYHYRAKAWISMPQSKLNFLGLYMCLADGDVGLEKGVQYQVKLFVLLAS